MDKKKILIFLAVCFTISLVSAGVFYKTGGSLKTVTGGLFAMAYMIIPLLSVLLTQLITKEKLFSDIGLSFKVNRWWWISWLVVMPLFAIISIPVSLLMPGVEFSAENATLKSATEALAAQGLPGSVGAYLLITMISAWIAGITINALLAFGEEAAWRGFLYRCFSGIGFWKKSLIIGAIWGLWHAPLILMGHNYPDHPVAGVFMMTAFCMLLSPLMVFIREKSGSVVVAAIAHGTMNAVAALPMLFVAEYNDLICAPTGVAAFLVLLVFDIAVALMRRSAKTAKS